MAGVGEGTRKWLQKAGWHKASKQFSQELRDQADGVITFALDYYAKVGEQILERIENDSVFPVYTGNLHDSIAVGVYRKDKVARIRFTEKIAERAQHTRTRKIIWGQNEAFDVIYNNIPNSNGITVKLVVGVPYAEGANATSSMPGFLPSFETAFEVEMVYAEQGLSNALKKYKADKAQSKAAKKASVKSKAKTKTPEQLAYERELQMEWRRSKGLKTW